MAKLQGHFLKYRHDATTATETHADLVTPLWVMCLLGLACCAVVQLYFLNSTLANSPVSYGVPTYQTLLTLLTIVSGGIFFGEFAEMTRIDASLFSVGVALALGGVGLHTHHRKVIEDTSSKAVPPPEGGRPSAPSTPSLGTETTKLLHP